MYRLTAMLRAFRHTSNHAFSAPTRQLRELGKSQHARSARFALGIGVLVTMQTQNLAFAASKPDTSAGKAKVIGPTKSTSIATLSKIAPSSPRKPKISAPIKAVPLKSLSARVAVAGWDDIGSNSWPNPGDSVIARANGDWVDVFRNPADPNVSLRLIRGRSVAGPVVLMAVGAAGNFVRVAIPLRPNGTLGWVRRSDVTLVHSTFRVEVDLSINTMTVFDGDKIAIRVPVAAGTGGTPTPKGLFFLKELVPQSPGGALGPYAFGLSGFSTVLTSFGGGEGVIGIHGTNAPGKLGSNVSHGCIRVDNVTITKMVRLLPLGTPVEIIESTKGAKPTRSSSAWLDTLMTSTPDRLSGPLAANLSSATDSLAPPVALSAEPVDSSGQTTTPIVRPTTSTVAPSTTLPLTDDLLGAVTAR